MSLALVDRDGDDMLLVLDESVISAAITRAERKRNPCCGCAYGATFITDIPARNGRLKLDRILRELAAEWVMCLLQRRYLLSGCSHVTAVC
ncbi:hypothetical protein BB8028_0009g01850 [Beauveria bassiana]|uniref:Uncharacterized protein n=1 Tax=Beauveria bassiana TaxID=176275 RepID=A0A2S7YP75_BEABA|nr:hypothetical protein BB8028_0009g01850 [Beauveria bassiana]